jgi:hypothetical protein
VAAQQQLTAAASFHSTPVLERKRKNEWHHVMPLPSPTIHPFSLFCDELLASLVSFDQERWLLLFDLIVVF